VLPGDLTRRIILKHFLRLRLASLETQE